MIVVLQLKIILKDSKPVIWRSIQVESRMTFLELHLAIQLVMGWTNSHLFEFKLGDESIGLPDEYSVDEEMLDASVEALHEHLYEAKQQLTYIYDFGDDWTHQIIIENIAEKEKGVKYPICIDGEMNCPPEDCGGIHGFYEILKVVKNKQHPEYKETTTWLGKNYNPESFEVLTANIQLLKLKSLLDETYE